MKTGSQVATASSLILSWIGIGTVAFHFLEQWTWVQSFYFSVVTLTTVGYGDFHPTSDPSRLFAAIYILVGVSTVVAALGVVGGVVIAKREERYFKKKTGSRKN